MTPSDDQLADVPPTHLLSQRQLRGVDCVFCCVVLRAGALRDLGPRVIDTQADTHAWWFPRCCRSCPRGAP